MDIRVEEMEICAVDLRSWNIKVCKPGMASLPEEHYAASLLSSAPIGKDGKGMYAVPTVGDKCTVLVSTERGHSKAYILGFSAPVTMGRGGTAGLERGHLQEGDFHMTNSIGVVIKSTITGGLHLLSDGWSKLFLSKFAQSIEGMFRNIYLRVWGGRIEWTSLKEERTSQYLSVIQDKWEDESNFDARFPEPIAPTPAYVGQPIPVYANKEITKIGSYGAAEPFKSVEIRAGAVAAGELPSQFIKEEYIASGCMYRKSIWNVNDGMVLEVIPEGEDKLSLGLVNINTGSYYFTLYANENRLLLNHTGDLTIAVDGAINVGGAGQEQQLVTRKFVEDIFVTHQHMGNNGAPTSPPLQTPTYPAARSNANHMTFDTKAE